MFVVVIVIGLVLLSWLTFGPWIRWRTTHYVFTTHRVLIRRGVFKHTGRDIALQRINDVGFTQTLWERIVNAGTLTIESAGEHGQEDLHDIPRSDDMQQLLNRLIEQDSDRRQSGAAGAAAHAYQQQYPQQQYPQQQYPQQQYPAAVSAAAVSTAAISCGRPTAALPAAAVPDSGVPAVRRAVAGCD